MTHLILTTSDSGAGCLRRAGIGDVVIPLGFRFVWGRLPSAGELEALLGPVSDSAAPHWLGGLQQRSSQASRQGGLREFCSDCESIELWIDPEPNAQLMLVQLLDYFRSDENVGSRLILRQTDVAIADNIPEALAQWAPPAVKILNDHLEVASLVWRAYAQPTPRDWFDLLGKDLSVLPRLGTAVLELLEELPMSATGLGATEMRMLELISAHKACRPFDVFTGHGKPNERRVFNYWEAGTLLDGLARSPVPAVSGLGEGPFTIEMHEDRKRFDRYTQSSLRLTPFGEAVLARSEDFLAHNPIDRWWGGTELKKGKLWRWDPTNMVLVPPSPLA